MRPLGELAWFVNGTSYDASLLRSDGTPIVRISNITNPDSEYVTTSQQFEDRFIVEPGDLLVSWSASFKTIIWPGPRGIVNQHIFRVRERPPNVRGYIRHAIEAAFEDLQRKTVGIGMMHLRRADFLGYEVSVPDPEAQFQVSAFLDRIEAGDSAVESLLPAQLEPYGRQIMRLRQVAGQIELAQALHQSSSSAAQNLVASIHLKLAAGRVVPLGDVIALDERQERVDSAGSYPQVGLRAYGQGIFPKDPVRGSATTYRAFNRLYEGAIVLSQVKGWEGAIASCPASLTDWYASPEYRTFSCIGERAIPEYFSTLVATPWFWKKLATLTRGVGGRRERIRPEAFLALEVPMPTADDQQRVLPVLRKVAELRKLHGLLGDELNALNYPIVQRFASATGPIE